VGDFIVSVGGKGFFEYFVGYCSYLGKAIDGFSDFKIEKSSFGLLLHVVLLNDVCGEDG
jgi:hypothetical protein